MGDSGTINLFRGGTVLGPVFTTCLADYSAGNDDARIEEYQRRLSADGAIIAIDNNIVTVRFWRKNPPMIGEGI